jgi:hypothetical protein
MPRNRANRLLGLLVAPEWPHQRVILSADGGRNDGPAGSTWWHVFNDEPHGELRAVGFSPSGRTLVVATASDVTLFRRQESGMSTSISEGWPWTLSA